MVLVVVVGGYVVDRDVVFVWGGYSELERELERVKCLMIGG